MKNLNKKTNIAGFSTLELLIAMAIMTVSMTAVIMVAFGNQSIAIDTELAQRGLYLAQKRLEETGASLKNGFDSVSSELTASAYNAIYDTQVEITDISECVKRIDSKAFWNRDLRSLSNNLSMNVADTGISAALGHDCATEEIFGWEAPKFYENPEVIHPGSTANDVDVIDNDKGVFAIIGSNKNGTHETLWIVDVTDPDNPEQIGAFDTDDDIYAVDAYVEDNFVYVYTATASTTAQLQVFSVDFTSYPSNDPVIDMIAQAQLTGVGGSEPAGRSVMYYQNKVYVGNRRTAGPEFHIFNNPSPASLTYINGLELNHSVNDIGIRNNRAYLAATAQTAQGCELIVIDVSNPASLINTCTPASTSGLMNYRAPGNFGGTQVEVLSNKVYLGRQRANTDGDFYILDSSNPNTIASLGSINLNLNSNTEVTGLKINGNLAFIATSDQTPANGGGPFLVYSINDPSNITLVSTCSINFSERSTALDIHDNTVYVTNEADDALKILYPSPVCI